MRNRLKCYAWILIFALLVQNFQTVKYIFFKQNVSVYTDDSVLTRKINGKKAGHIKFYYTMNNADLIITHKEISNSDYEKSEIMLYSPIVIIPNFENHTFETVDYDKYLNYKDIFMNVKEETSYEEMGIKADGNIHLIIPSEKSPYYEYVIQTLRYYIEDEEEMEEILAKCEKADDISTLRSRKDVFIMAPEMCDLFYNYNPAYSEYHIAYKFNVYINKNANKKLIEEALNNEKFVNTGIRSSAAIYSNLNWMNNVPILN